MPKIKNKIADRICIPEIVCVCQNVSEGLTSPINPSVFAVVLYFDVQELMSRRRSVSCLRAGCPSPLPLTLMMPPRKLLPPLPRNKWIYAYTPLSHTYTTRVVARITVTYTEPYTLHSHTCLLNRSDLQSHWASCPVFLGTVLYLRPSSQTPTSKSVLNTRQSWETWLFPELIILL